MLRGGGACVFKAGGSMGWAAFGILRGPGEAVGAGKGHLVVPICLIKPFERSTMAITTKDEGIHNAGT